MLKPFQAYGKVTDVEFLHPGPRTPTQIFPAAPIRVLQKVPSESQHCAQPFCLSSCLSSPFSWGLSSFLSLTTLMFWSFCRTEWLSCGIAWDLPEAQLPRHVDGRRGDVPSAPFAVACRTLLSQDVHLSHCQWCQHRSVVRWVCPWSSVSRLRVERLRGVLPTSQWDPSLCRSPERDFVNPVFRLVSCCYCGLTDLCYTYIKFKL